MTKEERLELFHKTLAFQNFDRPLQDVLISRGKYAQMMEHLGAATEREFLDALGSDFYYMSGRDISQNENCVKYLKKKPEMDDKYRKCPLGITWLRKAYDSKFSVDEALEGPFQSDDVTEEDILRFPWPKASDFDFSSMLGEWEENSDRITVGGLWTGIMGDSYRMMGFQNFLTNTLADPELVETLISRMCEMYLELNEAVFSVLKGKLNVWFMGNDFGAQQSLLMRPEMIEHFFFKHYKDLCDLAHSYGIHVMAHSCGSIVEIIPMLIEAGVEILDPIQVTARGMTPDNLANLYGGKIVFHGGIDTQNLLAFGTTQEVADQSQAVRKTLAATGGYIYAPSQILDEKIPCENIDTMYCVQTMR